MNTELIKTKLKEKRWSQADLAREIGVSPQVLSYWIQKKDMIRLGNLVEIAEALGVHTRELLE